MKRVFLSILIFSALLFSSAFHPADVSAKKRIIRSSGAKASKATTASNRLIIQPKIRRDRKALVVNFSNLNAVSSFTYELSYTASGIPQGVAGTVTSSGENGTQRELLFGTCSKTVCRYHTGIRNMTFVVTSTLKSGLKVRKTFRVKV